MGMRKHTAWYLKILKGNGKVRRRFNECETRKELLHTLYEYAHELEAASTASWFQKLSVTCWRFFYPKADETVF